MTRGKKDYLKEKLTSRRFLFFIFHVNTHKIFSLLTQCCDEFQWNPCLKWESEVQEFDPNLRKTMAWRRELIYIKKISIKKKLYYVEAYMKPLNHLFKLVHEVIIYSRCFIKNNFRNLNTIGFKSLKRLTCTQV